MSSKPLVSICLPLFNGASHLENALSSVLNQTYDNFEVVVVDDGSTDSSVALVKSLCKQDKRIRLYQNPKNLGLFANYNETIRQARGYYIKPFAQDDLLEHNALDRMSELLESH